MMPNDAQCRCQRRRSLSFIIYPNTLPNISQLATPTRLWDWTKLTLGNRRHMKKPNAGDGGLQLTKCCEHGTSLYFFLAFFSHMDFQKNCWVHFPKRSTALAMLWHGRLEHWGVWRHRKDLTGRSFNLQTAFLPLLPNFEGKESNAAREVGNTVRPSKNSKERSRVKQYSRRHGQLMMCFVLPWWKGIQWWPLELPKPQCKCSFWDGTQGARQWTTGKCMELMNYWWWVQWNRSYTGIISLVV